jgi:hypothetical protein
MNVQEQNKIRNYLLRRIDYSDLKIIINSNYRYAKNEFDPEYTFHSFNYAIASVIVEDLQIQDYINLEREPIYDELVNYFYETLKDRTKKLYKHLTEFD